MATRKRQFLVVLVLGGAATLQFGAESSADGPAIEPAGAGTLENPFSWRPSTASIGAGGTVAFRNPSTTVPHGVHWTGGPEKPSCSASVEAEKTDWSGSCTFAQPGTYAFVCTVHPNEMKGTITVSSGEGPPPPPPPGGPPESPLQGSASSALKLAKSQRGASVRGSVALSQASAGGRLQVLLLARQASLSSVAAPPMSRIGRLVRSPLGAGRLSFAVPLKRVARRALRRRQRLSLTVRVIVTPPGGAALTLTRGVVLHV
jgi:plastocyanin